jgi:hypothetical protein
MRSFGTSALSSGGSITRGEDRRFQFCSPAFPRSFCLSPSMVLQGDYTPHTRFLFLPIGIGSCFHFKPCACKQCTPAVAE